MCRVLGVSRSGFYSWFNRPESRRTVENRRLDVHIRAIYQRSKKRYGSPKITEELRGQGWPVGRNRVARRMKLAGIKSIVRRKYRPTTDSKHCHPVAPNIVNRDFTAREPDRVYVSDITYIATRQGWLYLTVILDLFSRMVVGWALSSSLSAQMVLIALGRAIHRRNPPPGLIFHSDRGVQYACDDFREMLKKNHMIQSMSRKGNCWDNAVAESFFSILKSELIHKDRFEGPKDTLSAIFDYTEVFYNNQRRHSTLGYLSPMRFEQEMKTAVCF